MPWSPRPTAKSCWSCFPPAPVPPLLPPAPLQGSWLLLPLGSCPASHSSSWLPPALSEFPSWPSVCGRCCPGPGLPSVWTDRRGVGRSRRADGSGTWRLPAHSLPNPQPFCFCSATALVHPRGITASTWLGHTCSRGAWWPHVPALRAVKAGLTGVGGGDPLV